MNVTAMSLLRHECGIHVIAAGRAAGSLVDQYGQFVQYAAYA
jgi:hypothetical protein